MLGSVAQGEKSPAGGENERVAVNTVDTRVAAVPAAAGAHAVVEEADGESAAVLDGLGELWRDPRYRTGTWGTRAVLQFRGEGLGEMGMEPRYPDWVGAGATGTWGTQKRSFGGGSEGHEGEGGGLDPAGGA